MMPDVRSRYVDPRTVEVVWPTARVIRGTDAGLQRMPCLRELANKRSKDPLATKWLLVHGAAKFTRSIIGSKVAGTPMQRIQCEVITDAEWQALDQSEKAALDVLAAYTGDAPATEVGRLIEQWLITYRRPLSELASITRMAGGATLSHFLTIHKNLAPELRERLQKGTLSFRMARMVSTLSTNKEMQLGAVSLFEPDAEPPLWLREIDDFFRIVRAHPGGSLKNYRDMVIMGRKRNPAETAPRLEAPYEAMERVRRELSSRMQVESTPKTVDGSLTEMLASKKPVPQTLEEAAMLLAGLLDAVANNPAGVPEIQRMAIVTRLKILKVRVDRTLGVLESAEAKGNRGRAISA